MVSESQYPARSHGDEEDGELNCGRRRDLNWSDSSSHGSSWHGGTTHLGVTINMYHPCFGDGVDSCGVRLCREQSGDVERRGGETAMTADKITRRRDVERLSVGGYQCDGGLRCELLIYLA